MDDKTLMETLLQLEKGACDLFLHGTEESATANVRGAFSCALDDALSCQNELYGAMAARGWYAPEQAEQPKIDALRQKYGA